MSRARVAELVGRLNPKLQGYDIPTPGGTSGKMITWEDISYGIAGIKSEIARVMVLHKYAGEYSLQNQVYKAFLGKVIALSHQHHWLHERFLIGKASKRRYRHMQMLERLAKLAYNEYMSAEQCVTCNGQHSVLIRDDDGLAHIVNCPTCSGTGLAAWGVRQRAAGSGFHLRTWRRGWDKRYRSLWIWVLDIERRGLWQLRDRMFGTPEMSAPQPAEPKILPASKRQSVRENKTIQLRMREPGSVNQRKPKLSISKNHST